MGVILTTVVDNKCTCCQGTGKYPSYMYCYTCQGTGYNYSLRRSLYEMKENIHERYINYRLKECKQVQNVW
jgi:DnaJ-class molecular chaperone